MASLLADRLDESSFPHVIEGDSTHDAIAITKMSAGVSLSPIDREIWLSRLRIQVLERVRAAEMMSSNSTSSSPANNNKTANILLTCSALQRQHRRALRNLLSDGSIETRFVLLEATEEELMKRVRARNGHYMKSHMVQNQLSTLEKPDVDEVDVLPVDTEGCSPTEVVEDLVDMLNL